MNITNAVHTVTFSIDYTCCPSIFISHEEGYGAYFKFDYKRGGIPFVFCLFKDNQAIDAFAATRLFSNNDAEVDQRLKRDFYIDISMDEAIQFVRALTITKIDSFYKIAVEHQDTYFRERGFAFSAA